MSILVEKVRRTCLHSMRKHDLCGFLGIFDGIETGAAAEKRAVNDRLIPSPSPHPSP